MQPVSRPDQRRRVRFVCTLAGTAGIVFVLDRLEIAAPLVAPLTELTAWLTLHALQAFDIHAVRKALVIYEPGGFAYMIHYRCTGLLHVAFLVLATFAYPARPRWKLSGLAVGIPLLLVLNLVRLVHLFVIGASSPTAFPLAHDVLWQGIMVLAVLVVWLGWLRWVRRKQRELCAMSAESRPAVSG